MWPLAKMKTIRFSAITEVEFLFIQGNGNIGILRWTCQTGTTIGNRKLGVERCKHRSMLNSPHSS